MDKTQQTAPDLRSQSGCWTSVSQRLSLKDELVMKAYSEDIDSLLTLDGLFSAVVTGFIALAVPMLQADSGQTSTQLLSTISAQLNSLVLTPPFINSTTVIPPVQPFQATATARWINSLWFISLVLSLASAVLGILAKQWIREYLQWKSPSAASRENVFLRELRSQAWDVWHVPALISAVPILLEVAILLFTCGLAAYVQTLDLVVGVVAIISVALFLLLVAALTLLPSACRHCPYKSPTAWTLFCLIRWLIGLHRRAQDILWLTSSDVTSSDEGPVVLQYNTHFTTIHSTAYLESHAPSSWRTRDLDAGPVKDNAMIMASPDLVLHNELEFELRDAVKFLGTDPLNGLRVSSAALRAYRATIAEADLLFKALVKLVMEAPNDNTLQIVAQCTQAMLTSLSCTENPDYTDSSSDVHLAELALDGAFHNISVWYMLSRLDSAGPGYMGPLVRHVSSSRLPDQHTPVTSVLEAIRLFILGEQPMRTAPGCAFLPLDDDNSSRTMGYKESPFHYSQYIVMNYVLAYRLQDIVSQMLQRGILDLGPSHPVPQLLHRRADEMLYTLRLVTFYWDSSSQLSRSCLWDCAKVLADVFNIITTSEHKACVDLSFPGLRTELFLVLSMSQYLIRCTSQLTLELGESLADPANRATSKLIFVIRSAEISLDALSEEDITIILHAVNFALSEVEHLTPAEIDVLCNCMVAIMESVKRKYSKDALLHSLHETWTDRLVSSEALGRGETAIVSVIYARSPEPLLRLLCALQADLGDSNATLARRLVHILRLIHTSDQTERRISTPESDPSAERQSMSDSERRVAALESCTTILATWRPDLFAGEERWHGLFSWTAGHWLREVSRGATATLEKASIIARSFPSVLCSMTGAIHAAVQNRWQEGLWDIVDLWTDGLLAVSIERASGVSLPVEDKDSAFALQITTAGLIAQQCPKELLNLVQVLIHVIHILGALHPKLTELRDLRANLKALGPKVTSTPTAAARSAAGVDNARRPV